MAFETAGYYLKVWVAMPGVCLCLDTDDAAGQGDKLSLGSEIIIYK